MSDAVDGVCAAMELVDDRHADYANLDAISLVADNSWNAGAVLGDFVETIDDLADLCGTVRLNGVEIDRGYGRDVLGHPLVPLTWLANHLAGSGRALRAGRCRADWQRRADAFPASRRHAQLRPCRSGNRGTSEREALVDRGVHDLFFGGLGG